MPGPHTKVYHFTSTARLPWIIDANELRPYRQQMGWILSRDFLSATIRSEGEPDASEMQDHRNVQLRLTLYAEDFKPWVVVVPRWPVPPGEQANFSRWHVRWDPLPLSRVISTEARPHSGDWQSIELSYLEHPLDPTLRGVVLGDKVYCSHCEDGRLVSPEETVSLADWPPRVKGIERRRASLSLSFEKFTDEQWQAIRSVRKSWPDDIDWALARAAIEQLGRISLVMRARRSQLGSPVKIRNDLRKAVQLTRELQAAINALPAPLRGSRPNPILEEQDWLQGLLLRYEYFAGPVFRGRRDPYRNWLEFGLLAHWTDLIKGNPSFARNLDGTPCGPLVEFLTLTLKAIIGSAPGPDGIANIIDQYRKAPDFPD